MKNLPGRKTDVADAGWLADLLAHGLIRGSFVPDYEMQKLRALLRARKQLVRERSSHTLRLQKTLEDANIKLDSVISDIVGVSSRRMLEALVAGGPTRRRSLQSPPPSSPPPTTCSGTAPPTAILAPATSNNATAKHRQTGSSHAFTISDISPSSHRSHHRPPRHEVVSC